jgi:hypothetical protein
MVPDCYIVRLSAPVAVSHPGKCSLTEPVFASVSAPGVCSFPGAGSIEWARLVSMASTAIRAAGQLGWHCMGHVAARHMQLRNLSRQRARVYSVSPCCRHTSTTCSVMPPASCSSCRTLMHSSCSCNSLAPCHCLSPRAPPEMSSPSSTAPVRPV